VSRTLPIGLHCSAAIARLMRAQPIDQSVAQRLFEAKSHEFILLLDETDRWWRWRVVDGAFAS
jgi:hypothetical protein